MKREPRVLILKPKPMKKRFPKSIPTNSIPVDLFVNTLIDTMNGKANYFTVCLN